MFNASITFAKMDHGYAETTLVIQMSTIIFRARPTPVTRHQYFPEEDKIIILYFAGMQEGLKESFYFTQFEEKTVENLNIFEMFKAIFFSKSFGFIMMLFC